MSQQTRPSSNFADIEICMSLPRSRHEVQGKGTHVFRQGSRAVCLTKMSYNKRSPLCVARRKCVEIPIPIRVMFSWMSRLRLAGNSSLWLYLRDSELKKIWKKVENSEIWSNSFSALFRRLG